MLRFPSSKKIICIVIIISRLSARGHGLASILHGGARISPTGLTDIIDSRLGTETSEFSLSSRLIGTDRI